MTPHLFLAYLLHSKYQEKNLDDEHLRLAHELVTSRQGVLSDLCAYQAESNPFPEHIFEEFFIQIVDPCVWWLCIKKQYKYVSLELSSLALLLLKLPSSSASIERILFSKFGLIQTKLRNRLGIEKDSK